MVPLTALWLPILVAAVLVFVASSIIWIDKVAGTALECDPVPHRGRGPNG